MPLWLLHHQVTCLSRCSMCAQSCRLSHQSACTGGSRCPLALQLYLGRESCSAKSMLKEVRNRKCGYRSDVGAQAGIHASPGRHTPQRCKDDLQLHVKAPTQQLMRELFSVCHRTQYTSAVLG